MKHYPTSFVSPQTQQGAVLLEALIAILIFSLGVLALAGLQSTMIKNTDNAKYRAEASFIAQQKLGEIWVNAQGLPNLAGYAEVDAPLPLLPNGLRTVAIDSDRLVTVTVNWILPGNDNMHSYTTNARIEGLN